MGTIAGYISLHRKLRDNPIYKNSGILHLFIELLLMAAHEQTTFTFNKQTITLERGQLLTGRFKLSEATGIPPGTIHSYLASLTALGIISTRPSNKFTVITLLKYDEYQTYRPRASNKASNKDSNKIAHTIRDQITNDNNKISLPAEPAGVQDVFKAFYQTINPNINFGNKTQRQAAAWLISKYGLEKTLAAAKYAIEVQNKQYAPTITNPYQLKEKMAALAKFKTSQEELGRKIWKRNK